MNKRKKFKFFLRQGERIVAEHKAQYQGVYYMDGGGESQGQKSEADTADAANQKALYTKDEAAGNTAGAAKAENQYNLDESAAAYHSAKDTGGGFLGEVFGSAAPYVEDAAAIAGSAFLGPEVGALIGPELGLAAGTGTTLLGQAAGGELASALGSGLVGAGIGGLQGGATGALEGGALGAAGGYLGAGGASDITNSLGITTNGVSDLNPFGTTAGGAPATASGTAAATPSTTTTNLPSSGGGTIAPGSVDQFGVQSIDANLGDFGQTTNSPNLGSSTGASSDSSLTAAGNAGTYGQPNTPVSGYGQGVPAGGASGTGTLSTIADTINPPGAPNAATLASNAATFNSLPSPDLGAGVPLTPAAAATGTATGGAAGATGQTGGFLNGLEKAAGNAVIPAAALGYEAIKGPSQLPGSATALQPGGAATAPLLGLEKQGATEAQTGQLTAPQQGQIQQFVQQQQNQILQQLASEGVQNPTQDSRYIAAMNSLQQQVVAMQQQFITQAIQEATSAGGAASQNIATAANEQIANDTAYQQALAAAFGGLGQAVGGGVNLGSVVNKSAT